MTSQEQFENIIAQGQARAMHERSTRRRTGKIARLPADIRSWVNQALLDGATYQDIRAELERRGHPDISDGCLTSWFQGGYQDWLHAMEHLQLCKAFSEHAVQAARELGNDVQKIADLNEAIVATRLTQCLYKVNPTEPRALDDFLRIARTVNQQARERSIRHRALLDTRKYNDQLKTKPCATEIPVRATGLEQIATPEIGFEKNN